MNNRCFRPVREEEIERVAEIAVRAWQPIFGYYREALGEDLFARLHTGWEERKAEQVRRAAHARPDCVYVTEIDGAVVGFITFSTDGATGVGEIGNNAVDPECQARGVGTAQHREVLRMMRECGMHAARVTTGLDPAHAPARRSYEKAGFDRSTSSVTYYMDLEEPR